jgi:hypothetical protein
MSKQAPKRGEVGWVLHCSMCKAPALRLRLPARDGDLIRADLFENPDGSLVHDGGPIRCPSCKTHFTGIDLDRGLC